MNESTSSSTKDDFPRTTLSLGLPRGQRGRGRGTGLGLNGGRNGHSMAGAGFNGDIESRPPQSQTAKMRGDFAIRSTDNDAMGSRLSAILQNYLPRDPFTPMLASNEASTSATLSRRSPIINIGTYLRCQSIDKLVESFLTQSDTPKQIISLGAGSDSRFWRLQSSERRIKENLKQYIELDFPNLTSAKLERIVKRKELVQMIAEEKEISFSEDRLGIQTKQYSLIPCDLRTLPNDEKVKGLIESNIDPKLDTLLIAECVLAYLSPEESKNLLAYFGTLLQNPFAICYEMCVAGDSQSDQILPPSRFGSVMLSNLQNRSLDMPGARAFSTLSSHATRFQTSFAPSQSHRNGKGIARTLKDVWNTLNETEKQRLSRLEGLDEVEELEILLSHYAISWYAHDQSNEKGFLSTTL